jgi:hypothetical protein
VAATNAKKGDRVWANCAFLDCPNCTPKYSASSISPYDEATKTWPVSYYQDHVDVSGRICPGGQVVPDHIKVRRVAKTGTVIRDGPSGEYGKGRSVWVQWDDEDVPCPNDVFHVRLGEPPLGSLLMPREVLEQAEWRFSSKFDEDTREPFDPARLFWFPKVTTEKCDGWLEVYAKSAELKVKDEHAYKGWRKCHTKNYWCWYAYDQIED